MEKLVKYEVHAYLGEANTPKDSNYPEGERHPIITFCRQDYDSEPDIDLAKSCTLDLGWSGAEFNKSGVFKSIDSLNNEKNSEFLDQYIQAIETGSALTIFGGVFNKNS